MKKLIVLCFTLILLVVPTYVFASSCDSAGSDYFITFTLDGEEYTCSFGHPDSEVDVPYAAVTTVFENEYINFYGGTVETGTLPEELSFIIEVEGFLYVETPGTYTGEYPFGDSPHMVQIWIYDDPDYYLYYASSGSIIINSFGEIGGAVEGTFDATFIFGGDLVIPAGIGDDNQTVSGSFRVKRISEEELPPPEIN